MAFPVALFDVAQGHLATAMDVSARDVGRYQLLNLDEATPQFTLNVVDVPNSVADKFSQVWHLAADLLAATPVAALLPNAAAKVQTVQQVFGSLGKFVDSIAGANKGAMRTTDLSLSTPHNPARIPLDNRRYVVFFKPSDRPNVTPPDSLKVCAFDQTLLCSNRQPYDSLPYLMVQARVDVYREFSSWLRHDVSDCQNTESDYKVDTAAVRDTALTDAQRDLEMALLQRLRLMLDVRAVSGDTITWAARAPDMAYRFLQLEHAPSAVDTGLWSLHGIARASRLSTCTVNEVRGHSVQDQRRWDLLTASFSETTAWVHTDDGLGIQDSTGHITGLERSLTLVEAPVEDGFVTAGAPKQLLDEADARIESRLLPYYMPTIHDAETFEPDDEGPAPLRTRIERWLDQSHCQSCRVRMQSALSTLARRASAGDSAARVNARVTVLKGLLAQALYDGRVTRSRAGQARLADSVTAPLDSLLRAGRAVYLQREPDTLRVKESAAQIENARGTVESRLPFPKP